LFSSLLKKSGIFSVDNYLCAHTPTLVVISRFFIFFSILLFIAACLTCFPQSEPAWLKPGFYAEYFLDSAPFGLILVPNSSLANSLDYKYSPLLKCNGTYRFELLHINASFARFNVTLDLTAWKPSKPDIAPWEEIEWIEFKLLQVSSVCDVDLKTLIAYKDGRKIGAFTLWGEFQAASGKIPRSFFGREVEANYYFLDDPLLPVKTPLGKFRYRYTTVIFMEKPPYFPIQLNQPYYIINTSYDRDTCLLIHGYYYTDEILLEHGILFFTEMYIKQTSVEFPQLKEQSYGFEAWHIYLALMLVGFFLPLIYGVLRRVKLLKKINVAKNLVAQIYDAVFRYLWF